MTCGVCRYELGQPAHLTAFEFRDDGMPFVAVKMTCPECYWPNIVAEHYGPTVWAYGGPARAARGRPPGSEAAPAPNSRREPG